MSFIIIILIIITIKIIVLCIYCKLTTGICKCSKHLVGKVVIVTGASSGIGYETALDLAERGARVILANSNRQNGIITRDKIIDLSGNSDVYYHCLDLSSFKSIRTFANNILSTEKRLDVLINNAGVLFAKHGKTEDGHHIGMQINYFGPFLLTNLILPLMIKTKSSRIINVSSTIYKYGRINFTDLNMEKKKSYIAKYFAYPNSKLCISHMTVELARRLRGTGVTVNVLHPGIAVSNILLKESVIKNVGAFFFRPLLKTTREAAQTTIYLAVSPEVNDVSGCYFEDCKLVEMTYNAKNIDAARKLWNITEKLVHL